MSKKTLAETFRVFQGQCLHDVHLRRGTTTRIPGTKDAPLSETEECLILDFKDSSGQVSSVFICLIADDTGHEYVRAGKFVL